MKKQDWKEYNKINNSTRHKQVKKLLFRGIKIKDNRDVQERYNYYLRKYPKFLPVILYKVTYGDPWMQNKDML